MAHFVKLNTPLRAVQKYPTTGAQEERFKNRGWSKASARNLWRLWNDPTFLTSEERISLDAVEPFDEWEEFALFGCHYFLLVASTAAETSGWESSEGKPSSSSNDCSNHTVVPSIAFEMEYSENPKAQGSRRFGAVMPLKSQNRTQDIVGVFGGMGLNTRLNTYDVYTADLAGGMHSSGRAASVVPSSRMCHSITDLGEAGALLVGGRTSPDNVLADCWLYHKWLDAWERVDDLPLPQYRHGAVNLGQGHVLISPGKIDSRNISTDFFIWSRNLGWVKCNVGVVEKPLPSYGATFIGFDTSNDAPISRGGLLAGGMSGDGLLLEEVWEFDLRNMSSQVSGVAEPLQEFPIGNNTDLGLQEPVITFKRAPKINDGSSLAIARFGASVVYHQGVAWVVGGIFKNEMLDESRGFVSIDSQLQVSRAVLSSPTGPVPRPLLIGSSVVSIGDLLLVMAGSAVCFSFGTFWNKGCYTLRVVHGTEKQVLIEVPKLWSFTCTVAPAKASGVPAELPLPSSANSVISVPTVKIRSTVEFDRILRIAKPVVMEGFDLGPCVDLWTSDYLKSTVGSDREVSRSHKTYLDIIMTVTGDCP